MKHLLPVLGLLGLAVTSPSPAAVSYNCGGVGSDFDANCSLQELLDGGSITVNGILFDTFVFQESVFAGTPLGPESEIRVDGVDSRTHPGVQFTDTTNAWNRSGLTVTLNKLNFRIRNTNPNPLNFMTARLYAEFGNIAVYDLAEQEDSNVFIKDRPFPAAYGDPSNPPVLPQVRGEAVVQCFASEADPALLNINCANTTRRDTHTGAQERDDFEPNTDMYADMDFNIIAELSGNAELNRFIYQMEMDAFVAMATVPDMNANGSPEIAVIQQGSIVAEVRDSQTSAVLATLTFLDDQHTPIAAAVLPDLDGSGFPELAMLAERSSDGQALVEIRDMGGPGSMRQIQFAAGYVAHAMVVIGDDADNDGTPELAVLATRRSDGEEVVEIRNAFGLANRRFLRYGSNFQVLDIAVVDDADGNGVPEIAATGGRFSNNRYLVQIRNAAGPPQPQSFYLPNGHVPRRVTSVADADGNGTPEVAVLLSRNGDGLTRVFVANANNIGNSTMFNYGVGVTPLGLFGIPDTDGDTIPEIALLVDRQQSANVDVVIDNAAGPPARRNVGFPSGSIRTSVALDFLGDWDSNGQAEVAVLLIHTADGRIYAQRRETGGLPGFVNIFFTQ
jgi:hypothetical protein